MTTHLRVRGIRALAVAAFALAVAAPAAAQEERHGFAKEGGFIGVTVMPSFTFDGETFDGMTAYREVDGDELFFLPKMDKQPLIRAILGYRARQASLEISYDRTQHDGTFDIFPLDSTYQAINVDGRFFFATSGRVQPYVLAGGSFPWLRVKEGSVLDPDVGDARFRGYGIKTEAGVTLFPTPAFGVSVGYNYRVLWFDRASGVSDRLGDLRPRFRETAGSVAITGTVVF
jgi:hypothetical protein